MDASARKQRYGGARGIGRIAAMLAFLAVNAGGCAGPPSPGPPWMHSLALGIERAIEEDKPILVFFDAEWCSICRRMKENTLANASVLTALENYVSVNIDVDRQPHIARKFGILAVPEILLLSPNGVPRDRASGYLDAGELLFFLQRNRVLAEPPDGEARAR